MIKIFLSFIATYLALYFINPIYVDPFLERPFSIYCKFNWKLKNTDMQKWEFLVQKSSPYSKSELEKKYLYSDIYVKRDISTQTQNPSLYMSIWIKSRFGNNYIGEYTNNYSIVWIEENRWLIIKSPPCRGNLFFELVPYFRLILIFLILSYWINYLYTNRKRTNK